MLLAGLSGGQLARTNRYCSCRGEKKAEPAGKMLRNTVVIAVRTEREQGEHDGGGGWREGGSWQLA